MQLELTANAVHDMADRVVENHPEMTKSKVLEVLAHAFGQRNFDALSGLFKAEASPLADPPSAGTWPELAGLKLPVTLWLECRGMDNNESGANWARLVLTQGFLEKVLKMQSRCRQWNASAIKEECSPDEWDELGGAKRRLNMQDSQLCVTSERFWFQAMPKYDNYYVETRDIYIRDLLALLEAGSGGEKDFCWVGDALYRDAHSVPDLFAHLPCNANVDWDAVEEWVGLHYQVNFEAEPPLRQLEWVVRYQDSHAE